MTKHAKPAPKHRGAPKHAHLAQAPKTALRNTVVLTSVAAAATGVAVSGGLWGADGPVDQAVADLGSADVAAGTVAADVTAPGSSEVTAAELGDREAVVSRSDHRAEADPAKEAALGGDAAAEVQATTETESLSDADPRDIGRALLAEYGFSSDQFGCLDSLWTRESGWSTTADNPTSSAYGIPQSLPGEKMASEGADWATNPVTQIRWGLGYIQDRYGSPCGAWSHSESVGWY